MPANSRWDLIQRLRVNYPRNYWSARRTPFHGAFFLQSRGDLEEIFFQVSSAFDTNPRFVLAATIYIVYSDSKKVK